MSSAATRQGASPIAVGERKVTSLVVDFLKECSDYHKVRFHAPVLFGLRPQIGLRGLYLAEGFRVKRNSPIFTVPFSGMLSAENVVAQPRAAPVTLADVEANLLDPEMRLLSHHILLGVHMAHQAALLPKSGGSATVSSYVGDGPVTPEAYRERLELFTGGIMPWARMLDDEGWSEEHVLGVHRAALDKWQAQDYADLFNMFNRNMTHLHTTLRLAPALDDLRRITRVVIARTEQVPLESELAVSRPQRLLRNAYRWATKAAKPRPALRLVPLMDMINHSNRANSWLRAHADGTEFGVPGPSVSLFALNDIEGGRELCRYYNFGMSRGNALFRYGFLPFEMMAMENFDPWKEHYARGIAPNLMDESEEERERRVEVEAEVARMQLIYRQARGGESQPAAAATAPATTTPATTPATTNAAAATSTDGDKK